MDDEPQMVDVVVTLLQVPAAIKAFTLVAYYNSKKCSINKPGFFL
jgi:hypothetical protein